MEQNLIKRTSLVEQGMKASNDQLKSLNDLSSSLKKLSEAAVRLEQIAEKYSADGNQKRISFTK